MSSKNMVRTIRIAKARKGKQPKLPDASQQKPPRPSATNKRVG